MELYQKMYAVLCGAVSAALDLLPATSDTAPAIALLQQALLQAEELYLAQGGPAELP